MLSDACFDLLCTLRDNGPVPQAASDFLEAVEHYSEPDPWDYDPVQIAMLRDAAQTVINDPARHKIWWLACLAAAVMRYHDVMPGAVDESLTMGEVIRRVGFLASDAKEIKAA